MKENLYRGSILGIEIKDKYFQVSYLPEGETEIITLEKEGMEDNDFPSCAVLTETGYMYFEEAKLLHSKDESKAYVEDIFNDSGIYTGEVPKEALAGLLKKVFTLVSGDGEFIPDAITFSVFEYKNEEKDLLTSVCAGLGVSRNNIYYEEYMESFYSFVVEQDKSVYDKRASLFFRSGDSVIMNSLIFKDMLLETSATYKEDSRLDLPLDMPEGEKDEKFAIFISNRLKDIKTSSVFLHGRDFKVKNLPKTIEALKNRVHIFIGNNLFSQGAVLSTYTNVMNEVQEITYIGGNKIGHDIYLEVIKNGQKAQAIVARAEENWFDIDASFDVIINEGNSFDFYVKRIEDSLEKKYVIKLSGLPERPERTTRLRAEIQFLSSSEMSVSIEDLGFGSFYPASFHTWKEIIDLSEME